MTSIPLTEAISGDGLLHPDDDKELHDSVVDRLVAHVKTFAPHSEPCQRTRDLFRFLIDMGYDSEQTRELVEGYTNEIALSAKAEVLTRATRDLSHGRVKVYNDEQIDYCTVDDKTKDDLAGVIDEVAQESLHLVIDNESVVMLVGIEDGKITSAIANMIEVVANEFDELYESCVEMFLPSSDDPDEVHLHMEDLRKLPKYQSICRKLTKMCDLLEEYLKDTPDFLAKKVASVLEGSITPKISDAISEGLAKRNSVVLETSKPKLNRREKRRAKAVALATQAALEAQKAELEVQETTEQVDDLVHLDSSDLQFVEKQVLPEPVYEVNVNWEWLRKPENMRLRSVEVGTERVYIGYAISHKLKSHSEAIRKEVSSKQDPINPCDYAIDSVAKGICQGLLPWNGLNVGVVRARKIGKNEYDEAGGIWYKPISAPSKPRIYFTLMKLGEIDKNLEGHPEANRYCVVVLAEANKTKKQMSVIGALTSQSHSFIKVGNAGQ